jgi:hypothetical protein
MKCLLRRKILFIFKKILNFLLFTLSVKQNNNLYKFPDLIFINYKNFINFKFEIYII